MNHVGLEAVVNAIPGELGAPGNEIFCLARCILFSRSWFPGGGSSLPLGPSTGNYFHMVFGRLHGVPDKAHANHDSLLHVLSSGM